MASANPLTPEAKRFAIRLPRPLWMGAVAVVLLVAAVGLQLWLPYHWEQQAIHEIEILDGDVTSEDAAPDWLRQIVGWELIENVKIFRRATTVILSGSSVADDELRPVSVLKNLRYLSLFETSVTDAGLVHLTRLQNLEQLDIEDMQQISDAGLVHLGGLRNLIILSLDDTPITDAGLPQLTRLKNLSMLRVKGTQVTDDGVESFYRDLPTCQISRQ